MIDYAAIRFAITISIRYTTSITTISYDYKLRVLTPPSTDRISTRTEVVNPVFDYVPPELVTAMASIIWSLIAEFGDLKFWGA